MMSIALIIITNDGIIIMHVYDVIHVCVIHIYTYISVDTAHDVYTRLLCNVTFI